MNLVNYYKKLVAKNLDPIVEGKLNEIEIEVYNDTLRSDIKNIKNDYFVDKLIVEHMVDHLVKWYTAYVRVYKKED